MRRTTLTVVLKYQTHCAGSAKFSPESCISALLITTVTILSSSVIYQVKQQPPSSGNTNSTVYAQLIEEWYAVVVL